MINDYSQDEPDGNVIEVAPVNAAATLSEREANPSLIHRVLHLNEWSEDFHPLYTANEESLIRKKISNRDVSGSGISNQVKSQIGDLPRLGIS
jgi:hypothetical protein